MPSVAVFIRELLSEDQYSNGYNERIDERIKYLNAAQLQGMFNHLKATEKTARADIWKNANGNIIKKIESELKIKREADEKEQKAIDDYRFKQKQKRLQLKLRQREEKRVFAMIDNNAKETAEKEVRSNELKRQADEKLEILNKIVKGEDRRNRWLVSIALCYVLLVVLISVVLSIVMGDAIIIVAAIFGISCISVGLCLRSLTFTSVHPTNVTKEELEAEVNKRADVYRKKAVSELQEKERKFIEQQEKDKLERRRLRHLKKSRERFEAELVEKRRLEQIAMAREILGDQAGSIGDNSSIAPSLLDFSRRPSIISGGVSVFSNQQQASDDMESLEAGVGAAGVDAPMGSGNSQKEQGLRAQMEGDNQQQAVGNADVWDIENRGPESDVPQIVSVPAQGSYMGGGLRSVASIESSLDDISEESDKERDGEEEDQQLLGFEYGNERQHQYTEGDELGGKIQTGTRQDDKEEKHDNSSENQRISSDSGYEELTLCDVKSEIEKSAFDLEQGGSYEDGTGEISQPVLDPAGKPSDHASQEQQQHQQHENDLHQQLHQQSDGSIPSGVPSS